MDCFNTEIKWVYSAPLSTHTLQLFSPLTLLSWIYLDLSSNSSNSCCLPFTHMKNIATNPARTIETIVSIILTPLWNSDTFFETSEVFCFNGMDEILVFI